MNTMHNTHRRGNRRTDRALRAYFEEQINQVRTPAPPSLSGTRDKAIEFWMQIKRVSAALVTAAAFALLIMTSGNGSQLSGAVDAALAQHDLRSEITGFIIEAGKLYRSEFFGGNKQ